VAPFVFLIPYAVRKTKNETRTVFRFSLCTPNEKNGPRCLFRFPDTGRNEKNELTVHTRTEESGSGHYGEPQAIQHSLSASPMCHSSWLVAYYSSFACPNCRIFPTLVPTSPMQKFSKKSVQCFSFNLLTNAQTNRRRQSHYLGLRA